MDVTTDFEDDVVGLGVDDVLEELGTLPAHLSQSIRGSSASSGQPEEGQPSSTPVTDVSQKKRRKTAEDDDIDQRFAELREERLRDRTASIAMYAQTNKRLDSFETFLMESSKKSADYYAAIMNQLGGVRPITQLLPPPASPQILIQDQPSGSHNSGSSSLPPPPAGVFLQPPPPPPPSADIAEPPPLPPAADVTTPPPSPTEVVVVVVTGVQSDVQPASSTPSTNVCSGGMVVEHCTIDQSSAPTLDPKTPADFSK